jgi:hypothetical protein
MRAKGRGRWMCAVRAVCVALGIVGAARQVDAQHSPMPEGHLLHGTLHAISSGDVVAPSRSIPVKFVITSVERDSSQTRPSILPPLYAAFALLQTLDAHSTLRAVEAGHAERNPLVAPFTRAPAAMIAVKATTTAGTIYITERLRRRHRTAAIVFMVGVNAAYAAIVARNYERAR